MKDAVSRRSRGFGFITYMSSASVDEALSVKQHIVDNRRVEAKRAVPRSEVPTKVRCGTHVSERIRDRQTIPENKRGRPRFRVQQYQLSTPVIVRSAPLVRVERETRALAVLSATRV